MFAARTSTIAGLALAGATAMLLAAATAPARAAEVRKLVGVVELFTSQGCSSCPPADKILTELADKGDVLALGWHVDYWDYLGWKDTFGSHASTERQRGYARSLHSSQVYTPQAIINGRADAVGSDREAILAAVRNLAGGGQGLVVPIETHTDGGYLKVRIAAGAQSGDATLWMVYFNDSALVDVARGENAGRQILYSNIVRAVEMIGMVKDQDLQTEFRISDLSGRGHDSCALILQKSGPNGAPGPIIGATLIRDLSS